MTDLSSLTLQNQLLTQEVKRRVDQLAAINTVAATVSQSLDLDATLDTALDAVLNIVEADAGGISLIDEEAQEVVLRAQRGWSRDLIERPMSIPMGQGMSGRVIQENEVIIENNLEDARQLAIPSFLEEGFHSIVMAPMHARGEIIGILSIMSGKPNSFTQEIVGVIQVIADTVGVALNNAQLYENAVEHETNLAAILDATTDGIIATDQKGRIRVINQKAESLLYLDAQQLIKTPLREIPIPPAVRDLLLRALETRVDQQETFEVALDSEKIISIIVLPVIVETQFEQNGETDGWVIVLRDVTHLRKAEQARAQFIAAAAHDMRSPLSVAINSIKLLETIVEDPDPNVAELVDLALNGVNRLQVLIDDVLRLEQIEGGYGVEAEQYDVAILLHEIVRQVRPLMESRQITFNMEILEDLPPLLVDAGLVNRAVINYLDNAIKYTGDGGNVILRCYVKEPMLHIEVSDNGPGIPLQEQSRLFERFYRAPGTVKLPGTGLGLAIVKSIAEHCGGDVYVRSNPGQGSTFGMTLALQNGIPG